MASQLENVIENFILRSKISSLEESIEEMKTNFEKSILEKEEDLTLIRMNNDRLESRNKKLEKDIKALKRRNEIHTKLLEGQNIKLRNRVLALKSDQDRTTKYHVRNGNQILKIDLPSVKGENRLKNEISKLEVLIHHEDITFTEKAKAERKLKLKSLKLECLNLKKLYRNERAQVLELKNKIVDLTDENLRIRTKFEDTNDRLNDQVNLVAKLQECNSKIKQKCEELNKTFQKQVKTMKEMKDALRDHESKIMNLESKILDEKNQVTSMTIQLNKHVDLVEKLKKDNSKLEQMCKDLKNVKEVVIISERSECEKNSMSFKESERKCNELSITLQEQVKTFNKDRLTLQTQKNFFKMKYDEKCKSKTEAMKRLKNMLQERDTKIVDLEAKVCDLKIQINSLVSKFSFEHDSKILVKTEIKMENN